MYRTTTNGKYSLVNCALAKIYGFSTVEELIESYQDIGTQLYVDPVRRSDFAAAIAQKDEVADFDAEIYRRDGSKIWIREHARCIRDSGGQVLYYESTVVDITDQKISEERIKVLVEAFKSVADGVIIADEDLLVQWANSSFTAISGYAFSELIGQSLTLPMLSDESTHIINDIWSNAQSRASWQGEVSLRRKNGVIFPAWLSMASTKQTKKGSIYFVLVCTDITSRKQIEEKLKYHANYDCLTGLPNRDLLQVWLNQEIQKAADNKCIVAVFYVDLDHFKPVNDHFGHHAGDILLKLVAMRMQNSLRLLDTVGRLGGDEFLVIAPDIRERSAAAYVAEKLRYAFSDPFDILGNEIYCTASIGIAYYPDHGISIDSPGLFSSNYMTRYASIFMTFSAFA